MHFLIPQREIDFPVNRNLLASVLQKADVVAFFHVNLVNVARNPVPCSWANSNHNPFIQGLLLGLWQEHIAFFKRWPLQAFHDHSITPRLVV
jgi:hypothetical protein